MRELELDITVPERIGEGLIYLDRGSQLEVDLRLESLHDGILASAEARATLTGQCGRCLQPLSEPWSGSFAELFGFEVDEALVYQVEQEAIDIEGPLRDTLVLDLPFQPLCDPDCLGLDPATGEKLTEPLPEPEAEIDPRWAQLQQLLGDEAGDESSDEPQGERRR